MKKIILGEKAADKPLTLDQKLKRSMLESIDRFQHEIDTRCEGIECISDRFAVLQPNNLIETSETELPKFVQSLGENYNKLSADGIFTEIQRLTRFLKSAKVPKEEYLGWTSLRFLKLVVQYELFDSVPNLTLTLRFFLTLCVSVVSRERSFRNSN
ncbi:hypothetical protein AVEN_235366-1 [Araneus ventricosus]|uniref:Uncharacterized protein n=1 Tax=Araneus ventricosus TaxID=182803 RepID=A0A4Y2A4E2_ARAVE|nr:hypothetical protein AVEN_235366-1 [Araneus ventricosus]